MENTPTAEEVSVWKIVVKENSTSSTLPTYDDSQVSNTITFIRGNNRKLSRIRLSLKRKDIQFDKYSIHDHIYDVPSFKNTRLQKKNENFKSHWLIHKLRCTRLRHPIPDYDRA